MTGALTVPLTVAVHGAIGAQGAPVVSELLSRGHRVRALSRAPRAVESPAEPVQVDLLDVDGLRRAYDGADAVVAVLPGGATDDDAVRQADAVLQALADAGVERAVFNPGGGVWHSPPGIPFLQARTRLALGLPDAVAHASVVGPGVPYLENYSERWVVEHLARTGELRQTAPADATARAVAVRDVATAVADVLGEPTPAARVVVDAGGEHTGRDVERLLSEHLGRPVSWRAVPPQEYLRGVAGGLGQQYADNLGRLYGGDDVSPPDPPGDGARYVRGTTTLEQWLPLQRWE